MHFFWKLNSINVFMVVIKLCKGKLNILALELFNGLKSN